MTDKELKKLADEVQDCIKDLNEKTNYLEGQGCEIKYTCSAPFNKIDFVQIQRVVKF